MANYSLGLKEGRSIANQRGQARYISRYREHSGADRLLLSEQAYIANNRRLSPIARCGQDDL
jgi:hypothetical protein